MANCALSNDAIIAYIQGRIEGLKKQGKDGPYHAILPVGCNIDGAFNDSGPSHAVSVAQEEGNDPSLPPQHVREHTLRERVLSQPEITKVSVSPDKNGVEIQVI